MKKDVVLLVIDSMGADEFDSGQFGKTCVPGIKKIMQENTYLSQYYSQGTHTESGVPGLMCGSNTLDYNAYLHRFDDSPMTLFDCFREKGYQCINISWGRNTLPSRLDGKVTNYYTAGFSFPDALLYMLPYYKKLYDSNMLTEKDKNDIIECYEQSFEGAIKFWDKDRNHKKSYELLGPVIFENHDDVLKVIRGEYELFKNNKWKYVENDIIRGGVSDVMKNIHMSPNAVFDKKKLKRIKEKNRKAINYLKRKQILSVVFDRRTNYFEIIRLLLRRLKGKDSIYLSNWYAKYLSSRQFEFDDVDKLRDDGASFQTQLELLEDLLKEKNSKPKFIYMHVNTIHPPIEWIPFDKSEDDIDNAIKRAVYLAKKTKKYHGDLIYRVGMGYADKCFYDFYKRIKKSGVLKNTIISLTADHGPVTGSKPVRKQRMANNCHSETYHVPMIFIDSEKKYGRIDGYFESIDYLPSIFDWCELKSSHTFDGKSFLDKNNKRDIVHMERIDSGCPCLEHRNALYVARNKKYLLEYEVGVYQGFEEGRINYIFDIENDTREMHNIKNETDLSCVDDILKFLNDRHNNLRKNYEEFCRKEIPDFSLDVNGWKEVKWNPRETV